MINSHFIFEFKNEIFFLEKLKILKLKKMNLSLQFFFMYNIFRVHLFRLKASNCIQNIYLLIVVVFFITVR